MEPNTPPKHDKPFPHSTPVKATIVTTFPFTTNQKYRVESRNAMASEVKKYIVGPMPPGEFLDAFFPLSELGGLDRVSSFTPGCYDKTVEAETETSAYAPFVSF